jgi:hypothetical protein
MKRDIVRRYSQNQSSKTDIPYPVKRFITRQWSV